MGEPHANELKQTPLHAAHLAAGAKIVPFAGYEMPVQYADGVLKEHLWTREHAGLFDVSHMGQATLVADDGRHETAAHALERLAPADILNLAPGRQRYTQLLNDDGGIIDDLMVSRSEAGCHEGTLHLVVNAARKDIDFAHLQAHLPAGVRLQPSPDRALIALQGPEAPAVLTAAGATMNVPLDTFMQASTGTIDGIECYVTRSGYTGEDGFEMSLPATHAPDIWDKLCADPRVKPIGLGARDSLRLEAGLCLYGHDIDETTSPTEAGLLWSIQKRRRSAGGFVGAGRVQQEIERGPARKRVGLKPDGRAPAREGTEIQDEEGRPIGMITSGGYGPSVGGPVAMGYVETDHAAVGSTVILLVRGKPLPATVATLPFTPHRYRRSAA
jgi:aminomethyltransferase